MFSDLELLLEKADLLSTLGTSDLETSLTVFAPQNSLSPLDADLKACLELSQNKDLLQQLLLFHIVEGVVDLIGDNYVSPDGKTFFSKASDFRNNTFTWRASDFRLDVPGDLATDATILGTTQLAANGAVQVIENMMFPADFACSAESLQTTPGNSLQEMTPQPETSETGVALKVTSPPESLQTTPGASLQETTPQPETSETSFALKVTSTLAGVTKVDFLAKLQEFREVVAELHSGKTAADVSVDEDSVEEVAVARRRLLATGVSVAYE
eukprot:483883-Rhodomonas_salina.1